MVWVLLEGLHDCLDGDILVEYLFIWGDFAVVAHVEEALDDVVAVEEQGHD